MKFKRIIIISLIIWGIWSAYFSIVNIICSNRLILAYKSLYRSWIWQSTSYIHLLMILSSLITALLFVLAYTLFYKGIPGSGITKGFIYSILIWCIFYFPAPPIIDFAYTRVPHILEYTGIFLTMGQSIIGEILLGYLYEKI